jgi:tetratricopeptide (TPR) repeat protein
LKFIYSKYLPLLFALALLMQIFAAPLCAQTAGNSTAIVEKHIIGYNDVTKMKFVYDANLYNEGWHTLPQPKFWQQVMLLSPDSAIVSLASTRQMLARISTKEWSKLTEMQKACFKDSIRKANNIADSLSLFVTAGKKDFYEFKKVMPTINRSINVFKQNGVDPWYAQAILLIESPGKMNTKSTVGANGPFQLMKSVAKAQGLVVNSKVDERTDIERSAYGASRLLSRICIPYVRTMLDSAHLTYNETDIWFRLLVLHAYHAGAGNVAGVIRKINPCEGGVLLMQNVWQTTYGGFKNASQNYSQLALAAFCNFNEMVMTQGDSVYLIDGDRMLNAYNRGVCTPDDRCSYLGNCMAKYESDLIDGIIPFDYFIEKTKVIENELAGLTPFEQSYAHERYNSIGFKLLKAKKAEEAYKVFKLNESICPDSWHVYQGLGESYRLMGKKELAIDSYKKSLQLNPNNEESLRAITRLTGK